MKIVILHDCFFSEVHLTRLRELGEVTVHESTLTTEDAISKAQDADVVIGDAFLVDFNKEFFDGTPALKLLALNTTAFAMVDLDAARTHGVAVANVPGFSKRAVAELAIGLMFDVVRRITYGDKQFRAHPSELDPASPEGREYIAYDLEGKTLGVVGVGRIGSEVAKIGKGLGMRVIGWNRTPTDAVELVDLKELVSTSDAVIVTLAYAEELKHALSRELLRQLKENAVIVNIGKKDLLDMDSLYDLLKGKKIRGAAIDWSQLAIGDRFFELDNIVLTPHIGSYTEESFHRNLPDMIVRNVSAFTSESPQNIVT